MHHHDIAAENGIGHDRHRAQVRQKGDTPVGVLPAADIGPQRGTKLPLQRWGVKHRTDDEKETAVSLRLVAQGPLHPNRGTDDLRTCVPGIVGVGQRMPHAAEAIKGVGKQLPLLFGAGTGHKVPVPIVTPDIELLAGGNQALQKKEILFAARHLLFHRLHLCSLFFRAFIVTRSKTEHKKLSGIFVTLPGLLALRTADRFCKIQAETAGIPANNRKEENHHGKRETYPEPNRRR